MRQSSLEESGVDENRWLNAGELQPMLEYLGSALESRKARLFACACCRLVWPLLTDSRCRSAVEVSERFAEGLVGSRELARAWRQGWASESPDSAGSAALYAASTAPAPATVAYLVQRAVWWAALRQLGEGEPPWSAEQRLVGMRARTSAERQQCDLLREIAGNPFHRPLLHPSWLDANDGAVRRLAQLIARDHDFHHLPVLGDALEEAGCTDAALLDHLRRPTGHVPGCWGLDVVLGRG
jgi:hypothetical protein